MAELSISNKYTVASLFSGIGGFCKAFQNVGFRIAWANEIDQFAALTYRKNFPEVTLYAKSITDLSVIGDQLESVDVLTAGFPCQPFSVAGNKDGFKDPRGNLFFEIIRLLKEFGNNRPKILLMENVKNLLTHNGGKTFSKILNEVQASGYWFKECNSKVLNTRVHTEIPQNRERLYMVALSWNDFDFNSFEFPEPATTRKEVSEFLEIDQPADPGHYFDETKKYGRLFAESMENGNQNSVYQLRRYYVRELKDFVVPTLTANMGEGGHNKPVIKDRWGIRNLTPTECLRLQGFGDEFRFPDAVSMSQQYKQVGNAVTVPLVEKLAMGCLNKLKSMEVAKSDRLEFSAQ